MEAIHDNSLNISGIYFDETVKDYSDSLNAVVCRQSPEYGETPLLMGMASDAVGQSGAVAVMTIGVLYLIAYTLKMKSQKNNSHE